VSIPAFGKANKQPFTACIKTTAKVRMTRCQLIEWPMDNELEGMRKF